MALAGYRNGSQTVRTLLHDGGFENVRLESFPVYLDDHGDIGGCAAPPTRRAKARRISPWWPRWMLPSRVSHAPGTWRSFTAPTSFWEKNRERARDSIGTLHTNAGEPLHDGVLTIEDERIAAIGSEVPAGARVLEAAAVVPGLINCHAHHEASGEPAITTVFVITTPTQRAYICAENARKALHAGVTTVRDLGSTENLAIDLRDAIARRPSGGPDDRGGRSRDLHDRRPRLVHRTSSGRTVGRA